jgi:hypothetical protein
MIASKDEAKTDFKYLAANGARTIMAKFVKNADMLEELVELCEDQSITGFQLKDTMRSNYNFESIKTAIKEQIKKKVLQDFDPRALANEYIDESDDEEEIKKVKEEAKKLRWGPPTYDI